MKVLLLHVWLLLFSSLLSFCQPKKDEEETDHEYVFQEPEEETTPTTGTDSGTDGTTTTTDGTNYLTTLTTESPSTTPPIIPEEAATTNSPSPMTSSATSRELEVITFLNGRFGTAAILSDDSTSQGMAVNWMANDDPLQYPIPPSTNYADAYRFVQRYTLAVLYYEWTTSSSSTSTTNATENLPFFLTAQSECDWNQELQMITGNNLLVGAQCNALDEISYIHLPSMNMEGTLPEETALLLALTHLSLPYNLLEGTIPNKLQYVTGMTLLDLQQNAITGTIPGTALQTMTSLTQLFLNANLLSGIVPLQFANLTALTILDLQDNDLLGNLQVLNHLQALTRLNLARNSFGGSISQLSLVDLANLQSLDLSDNFFQGTFPQDFLQTNTSVTAVSRHAGHETDPPLQYLRLGQNQFDGNLDETLINLPYLIALDVSHNVFTGTMPLYHSLLTQLQFLSLASNPWTPGTIPWELVSTTQFQELNLADTNRLGAIPSWLGVNHFSLQLLDLSRNDLEGTIPDSLGYIASLRYLLLNDNRLEGSLPVSMVTMRDNLQVLRVDGNRLTGSAAPICDVPQPQLVVFAADCHDLDDDCPCCTHCTNCQGCESDADTLLASNTWTHDRAMGSGST